MSTRRSTKEAHEHDNLLALHHQALQRRFAALVARASGGDPVELRKEWSVFEAELLAHLDLEEAELLPGLARNAPGDADVIRAEHADIRQALVDLGVKLDLHLLRAENVEAFVRQLEDHARREEQTLYAWADRHVTRSRWSAFGRALREAGRRGGERLLAQFGRIM